MKFVQIVLTVLALMACQQSPETEAVTADEPTKIATIKGCTKDLKVCPDGQSIGRNVDNQCQFHECPPPKESNVCEKDTKQCPDGRLVTRNVLNSCQFNSCDDTATKPKPQMMCTQDVKQCPDGSYVGRDSSNNCAFKPCKKDGNLK